MHKSNKFCTNNKKGFTLIELLIVIAILGLLASILTSSLTQSRAKARDAQRKANLRQIQTALEIYYYDHSSYPLVGGAFFLNETDGCPPNKGCNDNYVPGLYPVYMSTMPHDSLADQPVSGCGSGVIAGYQYYSNGKDYKIRAKCVAEERVNVNDRFYDPNPGFSDYAPYSYSVYTSGGVNF